MVAAETDRRMLREYEILLPNQAITDAYYLLLKMPCQRRRSR
jgi:hypothetical protein